MALLYASRVNKRINPPSSTQPSPRKSSEAQASRKMSEAQASRKMSEAQASRKVSEAQASRKMSEAQACRKVSTASVSGQQQRQHRQPTDKMTSPVGGEEQQDPRRKRSTASIQSETAKAYTSSPRRSSEESLTGSDSGKTKRPPKVVSKRSMTTTLANEQDKDPSTSRKISAPQSPRTRTTSESSRESDTSPSRKASATPPPRNRTGSDSGRDKPPDLRRILAMKRLIEYSIEVSSSNSSSPSPDRELIASLSAPRKKISVIHVPPVRPPLVRKRSLSAGAGAIQATLDEARASRKKDPIHGALSRIRRKFNKWKLRAPERSPSRSDTDDDYSSDGTVV